MVVHHRTVESSTYARDKTRKAAAEEPFARFGDGGRRVGATWPAPPDAAGGGLSPRGMRL